MERNRDLQNKMLKMKESTQRVVWVAVVVGGLAWAIGFMAGAILTLPDREETKASIASIKAEAKQELNKAREGAETAITLIARRERNAYNKRKEAAETVIAKLNTMKQQYDAEIARLKDERDSAIAELNQVKKQYDEALSKWNETRLSLDPEEKGNYDFQEVSINIKPRFILPDNLGMGN